MKRLALARCDWLWLSAGNSFEAVERLDIGGSHGTSDSNVRYEPQVSGASARLISIAIAWDDAESDGSIAINVVLRSPPPTPL